MKSKGVLGVVASGLLFAYVEDVSAGYRIYFQGSEVLAQQSGAVRQATFVAPTSPAVVPAAPLPAGALPAQAVPADPNNLSATCPQCVPGGSAAPHHGAGVPNQIVTFLHPYTNKAITVPLTLPVGRPNIVIRNDRVIYDYGLFSHKVIVKFLSNGLVEVIYKK